MLEALKTWTGLNDYLRSASETQCAELLEKEDKGKRRVQFLLRIYGRYNRIRSDRERRALLQQKKGK